MLLIGITGPVGSGKTGLLERLARLYREQGRRVDGFVAPAEGRPAADPLAPRRGAARYGLRFVATGETLPWAEGAPDPPPPGSVPAPRLPYHFDAATAARLDAWAAALAPPLPSPSPDAPTPSPPHAPTPPHLLVLDEFGRAEAAGGGLVRLWPHVAASGAAVVALAVRQGTAGAVATHLGRPFDALLDAARPDAWERLRALAHAHDDWARVGLYGAGAGGVEAGLGSALHAGHVPMRGLVLSGMQAVVLTHAGAGLGRRTRLAWVPLVAAGLKALSPAGSRLRPMLAITVQGLLFTAATALAGWNAAGVFAGGALVGAWAAAQGLALQFLFVGAGVEQAYSAMAAWLGAHAGLSAPPLGVVMAVWALAWGAVTGTAALVAWRRGSAEGRVEAWLARRAPGRAPVRSSGAAPSWRRAFGLGARELLRPTFWLPVALVAGLVVAGGGPWSAAAWMLVRAASVALVLYALARRARPDRLAAWLRRRGHWGPSVAFERAMRGREGRD